MVHRYLGQFSTMNSPIDLDVLKELLQRCKAWTKQVEWMISTGADHGVTPAQLDALRLLQIQEKPLPELGTTNWVGLINGGSALTHEVVGQQLVNAAILKWTCLCVSQLGFPPLLTSMRRSTEYCQQHLKNVKEDYDYKHEMTAEGTLKWRCTLTVPGIPMSFPREEDCTPEPLWPSKREAKQFAAKCGYTWMKSQKDTTPQAVATIAKTSSSTPSQPNNTSTQDVVSRETHYATSSTPVPVTTTTSTLLTSLPPHSNHFIPGLASNTTPTISGVSNLWHPNGIPRSSTSALPTTPKAPESTFTSNPNTLAPATREQPQQCSGTVNNNDDGDDDDNDDDDFCGAATKNVNDYCTQLGIAPPEYIITAVKADDASSRPKAITVNATAVTEGVPISGVCYFNGKVKWSTSTQLNLNLPDMTITVTNVLSREGCKKMLAEKVVDMLRDISKARVADLQEFLRKH